MVGWSSENNVNISNIIDVKIGVGEPVSEVYTEDGTLWDKIL